MINLTDYTFNEFIQRNDFTPILVIFTSTRCGPCKAMYPILESLKDEIKIIFTKVDTDSNPTLISYFKIQSVPTLFLINNGNLLRRTGFLGSKQEIINFIKG